MSDQLVNDCPKVSFDALRLYKIVIGDRLNVSYKLRTLPSPYPGMCTALYRGYVARFRLHPDGTLELVQFSYPFSSPKVEPDLVSEMITGNFWLQMKQSFNSRTAVYVPFRKGHIVTDRWQWLWPYDVALP